MTLQNIGIQDDESSNRSDLDFGAIVDQGLMKLQKEKEMLNQESLPGPVQKEHIRRLKYGIKP